MTRFDVYVTELWTRRHTVDADSAEEAKQKVKEAEESGDAHWPATMYDTSDPAFEFSFQPDGEGDMKGLAWTVERREDAPAALAGNQVAQEQRPHQATGSALAGSLESIPHQLL